MPDSDEDGAVQEMFAKRESMIVMELLTGTAFLSSSGNQQLVAHRTWSDTLVGGGGSDGHRGRLRLDDINQPA